jgi:hypothetical protein
MLGGLLEASLIVVTFFFAFFTFFIIARWRCKWRRLRVRGTGTTIKAVGEATKAHVSVPLLHWVL